MLWDPGSVKDGGEEEPDNIPVTPILVPLQNKPTAFEKSVPVLVPDVQDLKDQFQQQQNMLTQIKETLKQNESQLSSKGKQVEVYANKLSQIRARSKNTQGKKSGANSSSSFKTLTKKPSKENLAKMENQEDNKTSDNNSKLGRKGKVSELKKCLEENKIKFEQRTGKEQSETKKIESLVEQLKTQLEERDKTIQDLQKDIEQPTPKPEGTFPKKAKQKSEKESVASKTTQTNRLQPSEDSVEVTVLRNKIYELEANVLDLEENLKEKESVIEARTQAVTLLSQDLSLKGKNTLESLEETRQEMRAMQNNFIAIEDNLKRDLRDRDNRLAVLEEICKKLESTNFDLSLRNAEQQEKLVNLQEEAERKESSTTEELAKKISLLTKELDDRNKSMIKMKIEHKNKIKSLNKTLESLKAASDDKAEIIRLGNLLEEFENVKIGLENRVAELEDEKASEKKLKGEINELEVLIKKQNEDLTLHLKTIANLEKDNLELIQSNQEQNVKLESLRSRIESMEALEANHERKMEAMKTEHCKEIEMLEAHYRAKGDSAERKELEEYRISTEINNIHVEEQIELLVREKQQLLEKLKSLSGVSSTDSLTFEKMEHSDLGDDKETTPQLGEEVDLSATGNESRSAHLQRILNDQQILIKDLEKTVDEEKEKASRYQQKIIELETTIKHLEDVNGTLKLQVDSSEGNPSQKSNLNAKNRFKKIQMDLSQSRKTIQEQKEKLEELNEKLEEKENLIKKYTEKMEGFEKDDWDRQNHWKNAEDDIDSVQELQKKCLSLENSLIEVNEDCERLRKENIEVVHLLSEEKVKRRKLLEQMQSAPEGVEERITCLNEVVRGLEEKVAALESRHSGEPEQVQELEGKLEWANVVLTSKETEIFRLQNLLEDRSKSVEILEGDLIEYKAKLKEKEKKVEEMVAELKAKEVQLEEISENFGKLQECVDAANQKTATNEAQLEELLATVKEMEGDAFRKESELQEIKGILAEKNLDMTNLRNRLEEVNSDLTYSYQEHLENMGKCLRDKESDFEQLLAEKNLLEDVNRSLVSEKEDIYNQKVEVVKEKEKLEKALAEAELRGKEKPEAGAKSQEMDDLKIKMKKLAANLKKKAQNEADLVKQVKELEGFVAEKEKAIKEVTEKWEVEKEEKEKIRNDLSQALAAKLALQEEIKVLAGKRLDLEKGFEDFRIFHEEQVRDSEAKVQKLRESCNVLETTHQQDRGAIADLENRLSELSRLYQNAKSSAVENQRAMEEERKTNESLLQKLAEATGKLEEMKFKREQLLLEKADLKQRLEGADEKAGLDAKIQESMAVVETLEAELAKTRDQMKMVEEKFFHSEERRMSLENKNEEMWKKMAEDSETLVTIDDLSVRVDELLKSEKCLQDCVRVLESGNSELKQALDQVQSEKYSLEAELRGSGEKVAEAGRELKRLRESEAAKSSAARELTKEVERLRAENKQLASDFEKLNRDYEQFEVDFKDNLDNFQKVEKSLRHKIEELTNENSGLLEKCNMVAGEEKSHESEEENKKPKKRKSVTFRTDEVEYIKELKNQLHNYDASLKQANEEIENLRGELFREKLRHEVSSVVAEAEEKVEGLRSSPENKEPEIIKTVAKNVTAAERKFDASVFFGKEPPEARSFFDQSPAEPESLMWDDGWGTDGHLEEEYLSGKAAEAKASSGVDSELEKLREENERLAKESQDQVTKYAKALKKLKELKTGNEKLQSEITKMRSSSGLGDLDAAIVEELKSQIQSMEAREKDFVKSLENAKAEKESLLKKIDVLNAGNEKFLEMKERQDNEAELWQRRNDELLREISNLRQEMARPQVADEDSLMREARELRNKMEALEWKNCELNELLEEKQELLEGRSNAASEDVEKIMQEKSLLEKEIEELKSGMERLKKEEKQWLLRVEELNGQLEALATENETLQDILGGMKESAKKEEPKSKIVDYFKSSGGEDLFPVAKGSEAEDLRKRVLEVEGLLRAKDEEAKREAEAFRTRVSELEGLVKAKGEEVEKTESVRRKLTDLESALAAKNEELREHRNLSSGREDELEALRQRLEETESESGKEIGMLRQSVFELETFVRLKDEELQKVKESREKEAKSLGEVSNFETIDLNERPEEAEMLRQRIFELEKLLSRGGEERNEEEKLRQRVFHLEEILGRREEELGRLQAEKWNGKADGDARDEPRQRLRDAEELVGAKESEVFQIQAAKANAEQKMFEVENLARFKEEESRRLGSEVDSLRQKVIDLESVISEKDEEIGRVTGKLHELEKSYNDSKLEIERLLNEEKLNTEEKFVEPFQKNIQIPVPFELEALSRTLHEEKQKSENLKYELSEKEKALRGKDGEIQILNARLAKEESERKVAEGSLRANARLEQVITELEQELESCNLQLSVTRRELEEFQNVKDEAMSNLKSRLFELESELLESREKFGLEIRKLEEELREKNSLAEKKVEDEDEKMKESERSRMDLGKQAEALRAELERKENESADLGRALQEARLQVAQLNENLRVREAEVSDLRQTLIHLQGEITQFRNFEKQVKELRAEKMQKSASDTPVTSEGHPAELGTDWTEHELAELSTRLQSDLDTALYMLHQRDVRCDELTFELMQLLEERDTLQLRLSTALRTNEELKCSGSKMDKSSSSQGPRENKDLVDQANDREAQRSEGLRQLASKISELHSVSYLRDKRVKDDSVQRHQEQMNLLSRISDSDISLSRDVQSSPAVLLNWVRGKTTPKVMHI